MDYQRALNELYRERHQLGELIKNLNFLCKESRVRACPKGAARTCLPRNVKSYRSGCEITGHLATHRSVMIGLIASCEVARLAIFQGLDRTLKDSLWQFETSIPNPDSYILPARGKNCAFKT
jgi:hypothetical protein